MRSRSLNKELHKGKPWAALVEKKNRGCGRNNDWPASPAVIRAVVPSVPIASSTSSVIRTVSPPALNALNTIRTVPLNIALACFAPTGERRYVVAPEGPDGQCQEIFNGPESPIKAGNTLPLRNIPVGSTIHCIELLPGKGAQLVRAAGTFGQLIAREGEYAQVRLRSGEVRRVLIECRATIGTVGNEENSLRELGKAGAKRWRGVRPTVRGVAMNPVDHPHGGGEGKTGTGRAPVTPWGQLTKGYRTRNSKRTDSMIVQRRNSK